MTGIDQGAQASRRRRHRPVDLGLLLSIRAPTVACLWLLLTAGLLGGGRGGLGDTMAQGMAVVLLAMAASRFLFGRGTDAVPGMLAAWSLLVVLPPLLQLLPLPESLWALPPARAELTEQLRAAGVEAGSRWSLNPLATEQALYSLLPALALYIGTLYLPTRAQLLLLGAVLVLATLNVLMGMAQLGDGPNSGLRWYLPTNPSEAVGFFANRNHLASLLAMALPVAMAGTAWVAAEHPAGRRRIGGVILGITLVVLLVLGIALARSRAGLLLGMLAVLLALPMVLGLRRRRGAKRWLALALGVGLVASVQFALLGLLQRFEADPLEDARWKLAQTTMVAAEAHAPLGSGFGTFRQAYPRYDETPEAYVVNHAHNDYAEAWLEGGYLALVAFAGVGVFWLWASWQAWRPRPLADGTARSRLLLVRACWSGATLALLHESVDYPLRTTAASAVFAVLVAVTVAQVARLRASEVGGTDASPLPSALSGSARIVALRPE